MTAVSYVVALAMLGSWPFSLSDGARDDAAGSPEPAPAPAMMSAADTISLDEELMAAYTANLSDAVRENIRRRFLFYAGESDHADMDMSIYHYERLPEAARVRHDAQLQTEFGLSWAALNDETRERYDDWLEAQGALLENQVIQAMAEQGAAHFGEILHAARPDLQTRLKRELVEKMTLGLVSLDQNGQPVDGYQNIWAAYAGVMMGFVPRAIGLDLFLNERLGEIGGALAEEVLVRIGSSTTDTFLGRPRRYSYEQELKEMRNRFLRVRGKAEGAVNVLADQGLVRQRTSVVSRRRTFERAVAAARLAAPERGTAVQHAPSLPAQHIFDVTGGPMSVEDSQLPQRGLLSFELMWAHDGADNGPDIDLHVIDPNGQKYSYAGPPGFLDYDDRGNCTSRHSGGGPERIPFDDPVNGTYEFFANNFSWCNSSATHADIEIMVIDASRRQGPYRATLTPSSDRTPVFTYVFNSNR